MNRFFYILPVVGLVLISGCTPSLGHLSKTVEGLGGVEKKQAIAKDPQGFELVKKKFSVGKVMEAYRAAQAITPNDKHYAAARLFLKKTLNPARIRLLRHYKNIAKKAERERKWYKAWVNYKQAAEFSAKPEVFNTNIATVYLHGQQLRLNTLLKQRRLEDHALLQGLKGYQVPKGVAKRDVVFLAFSKQHHENLSQRAEQAYIAAKTYVAKKKWVAAYVLIESHLRLMPDSSRGEKLLHSIQKAWLKGLVIPKALNQKRAVKKKAKTKTVQNNSTPLKPVKKTVVLSKNEIQALMQQAKWTEAQDAALVYQEHQGEGADVLLQNINAQIHRLAEQAFQRGGVAFQHEHIDQAVQLWDEAVQLEPDNETYLDALSRALSLQERLHLLRHKK
ncbi:MAG: hypothetical protein Q9M10_04345 [Mariprofundaceae bacterium]|nr:hypothetical protein [Mariprofundaceae bacterium]